MAPVDTNPFHFPPLLVGEAQIQHGLCFVVTVGIHGSLTCIESKDLIQQGVLTQPNEGDGGSDRSNQHESLSESGHPSEPFP